MKADSQVKNLTSQHSVLINHTKHANVPVLCGWAENMLKIQAKDSQHGKISDTGELQAKKTTTSISNVQLMNSQIIKMILMIHMRLNAGVKGSHNIWPISVLMKVVIAFAKVELSLE